MAHNNPLEPERMGATGSPQRVSLTKFLLRLISALKLNPFAAQIISFILNSPLYKGAFILGSGTAAAQIVGIISMPIITRLYTPSDLGILAVYSSILAIVGIVGALRYEFAYALPKQDEDAANLFGLCLILLFITTACFALILLLGSELLIETFDLGSIERYLWALFVGFFGMGLYTILNYWAIRQMDYKMISYTKINQGVGGAVCKILLGILSFGPTGLIVGHIVSQITGIGTLACSMWRKDRENLKVISLSGMKNVAKTYKSFPIFNLPAAIANAISLQLPPLALLALYDSQVVGFYALAHMLMVLPASLITTSIGQAYFGEASKMVREESPKLLSMYLRTLKHLSMIAVPLIGIPALCAPVVVPIIFGEDWVEAGWYCWPLALMMIAGFAVSPISLLSIYGYNHWRLMWDVTRVVGTILGFIISQLLEWPILITLTFYAIIMFVMYISLVVLVLKAINNFDSNFYNRKNII